MKKILNTLLPAILCFFCITISVSADDRYDFFSPYVLDNAAILSSDKELAIELEKIIDKYGVDIVVLTVDSLDGKTATEYADDFYDYNGYSEDGILFLLSMEDRDWAISTKGYGITAFTDYGQDYIFEQMKSDLGDDNFDDAMSTFASQCKDFLEQAENDEPYDTNNKAGDPNYNMVIIASVVFGLITALIVVLVLKGQLKSVKFNKNANLYIKSGSAKVTNSQDIFLYKTLTKTKIESDSSSGGGSSTHTSSSGSTHGGSSGKF